MKKLNRKGFTLVELLAVIIILAIVVGITIPAITNIINDSKNNALGVAVDAASDYLTDQYGYMNIDRNTATDAFLNSFEGINTDEEIKLLSTSTDENEKKLIQEMGFDLNNVNSVTMKLDAATGKICVKVDSIDNDSEYYSTSYWSKNTASGATDYIAKTGTDAPKNSNCE